MPSYHVFATNKSKNPTFFLQSPQSTMSVCPVSISFVSLLLLSSLSYCACGFCDEGPPGRYCLPDLSGWHECSIDPHSPVMTDKLHRCEEKTRYSNLCLSLSVCLSVYLPVCLPICLSAFLPAHLSVRLFLKNVAIS